jgi:NADPH:quinone reductase-like Zn-dependent oxidoreductase
MKAVVHRDYGAPDVLRLEDIARPVPDDDQVLVKVRAASVNPLDWHLMEGSPYVMRLMGVGLLGPSETRLGVDYAGTVEAVGKNVTRFKAGDDVFGGRTGALAEYLAVRADGPVALKPARLTFEQAAAVPIAGITALQALRDAGKVQPGQRVLINGASGGVGTFAVQIAKALGADVTGVCSTRNVDLVRSLGADQVVDYTKADFTEAGQRYDVIVDNVLNHSLLANLRVLQPKGRYVLIGGGGLNEGRWLGKLARPIRVLALSRVVSQDLAMMLADLTREDLGVLADLMEAGKVTPVIDRRYRLAEVPAALRYLEEGHARGKVVITLDGSETALVPAGAESRTSPEIIALALLAVIAGVTVAPVVAALVLNRRFRRRNPGKRPYRWGYYFSIVSFVGGLGLGVILEAGAGVLVACGALYGGVAWFFARRRRWAWLALTILSFNPVAWVINLVYLRKRWTEDSVAAPGA